MDSDGNAIRRNETHRNAQHQRFQEGIVLGYYFQDLFVIAGDVDEDCQGILRDWLRKSREHPDAESWDCIDTA